MSCLPGAFAKRRPCGQWQRNGRATGLAASGRFPPRGNNERKQYEPGEFGAAQHRRAAVADCARGRRSGGQTLFSSTAASVICARRMAGSWAAQLRCRCGATYEAPNAAYGRRRGGVYACSAARRKGRAVCGNNLHLPIAETENAILASVESDLLQADVFATAVILAADRLQQQSIPSMDLPPSARALSASSHSWQPPWPGGAICRP